MFEFFIFEFQKIFKTASFDLTFFIFIEKSFLQKTFLSLTICSKTKHLTQTFF